MLQAYFIRILLNSPSEVGEYIDQTFILVSWTTKSQQHWPIHPQTPKVFPAISSDWNSLQMEPHCSSPVSPKSWGDSQQHHGFLAHIGNLWWSVYHRRADATCSVGWWVMATHGPSEVSLSRLWCPETPVTTVWKLSQGERGLNTRENLMLLWH